MSKVYIENQFGLEEESKRYRVMREEASSTRPSRMKISGVCQKADVLNANGRIYPRTVLESGVSSLMERVKRGRGFGELDHPTITASLKNTSHILNNVWWDEQDKNLLCCEVTILDTPAGKTLKEIVDAGGRPGFSSRGTGESERVVVDGKEVERIKAGFNLASFDFVIDPSVTSADIMKVMESAVEKYAKEESMEFKTAEELKAGFPTLVKEIEDKVVEEAEKLVEADLAAKIAELEDAKKKVAELEAEVVALKAGEEGAEGEVETLKQKVDELEKKLVEQPVTAAPAPEVAPEKQRTPEDDLVAFVQDLLSLMADHQIIELPEEETPAEKVPAAVPEKALAAAPAKKPNPFAKEGTEEELVGKLEEVKKVASTLEEENKKMKEDLEKSEEEKKRLLEESEKAKVSKYLEDKLKGNKWATLLTERLAECKTTEEVDGRLKNEELFIKALEENFPSAPKGKGVVGQDFLEDADAKAVRDAARRRAGLSPIKSK